MLAAINTETPAEIWNNTIATENMALYRGYLAWVKKQQYFAERTQNGKASTATAEALIRKIWDSVNFLSMQYDYQWKQGFKRFVEKEVFLSKKPEEFSLSFWQYWKRLRKKEKILPHILVFYFSFTKTGASLYWKLSWPLRLRKKIQFLNKRRMARNEDRLQKIGTGKSA